MNMMMAAMALALTTAAAPTVTGTWTMTVEGGPHGSATMSLILKQDGSKVTGTFSSGHSADMPVTGEFAEGSLKIQTAADKDGDTVTFNAKMKDDGTLAGYLSSPMGDMKWTATRADKDRK
jgi:hypothetical protein